MLFAKDLITTTEEFVTIQKGHSYIWIGYLFQVEITMVPCFHRWILLMSSINRSHQCILDIKTAINIRMIVYCTEIVQLPSAILSWCPCIAHKKPRTMAKDSREQRQCVATLEKITNKQQCCKIWSGNWARNGYPAVLSDDMSDRGSQGWRQNCLLLVTDSFFSPHLFHFCIVYTYSKSPVIIGLQKKSQEACFHVRYRACSSAANVSALLFKVDFPLSNS